MTQHLSWEKPGLSFVKEKSHHGISSDKDLNRKSCFHLEDKDTQNREKTSVLCRKLVVKGKRM